MLEGEADFTPATAIADKENGGSVFEGLLFLPERGEEGEEVSGRGVGDDETEGHLIVEEFEADLRGAVFAEKTRGTTAAMLDGLDGIEASADGLFIAVKGSGVLEAK